MKFRSIVSYEDWVSSSGLRFCCCCCCVQLFALLSLSLSLTHHSPRCQSLSSVFSHLSSHLTLKSVEHPEFQLFLVLLLQ